MKVLLTTTSLKPAYGGPAISVSRMALALADAGVAVGLWAADGSAIDSPFLPDCASVERLDGGEAEAMEAFPGVDVIHDNGLWMPHHHRWASLCSRQKIPRIVSVRGMLEPWAIRHKPLKKNLAWWLYQARDLRSCQCLHATAEQEAKNLEILRLSVPVRMIPNGVDVPGKDKIEQANLAKADAEVRTAIFLGRIYPVKGLDMLVEAWAQLRPQGWRLLIAGPDEAGHQKEIETRIARAGLQEVVTFTGPLSGEDKTNALLKSHLFVLPSHSESFGMAAAEALAHGLPVLATRGTPWSGLNDKGCGWWVDASVNGIAQALKESINLSHEQMFDMGLEGYEWMRKEYTWLSVAPRFIKTYEQMLRPF